MHFFFLLLSSLKKKLLYSIFLVARSIKLNQSLQNHDLLSEEDDVVGGFLEQLVGLDVSIVDRNEALSASNLSETLELESPPLPKLLEPLRTLQQRRAFGLLDLLLLILAIGLQLIVTKYVFLSTLATLKPRQSKNAVLAVRWEIELYIVFEKAPRV
ncbi:hypothetical protein AAG906_023438 [Vitis piasezkii]